MSVSVDRNAWRRARVAIAFRNAESIILSPQSLLASWIWYCMFFNACLGPRMHSIQVFYRMAVTDTAINSPYTRTRLHMHGCDSALRRFAPTRTRPDCAPPWEGEGGRTPQPPAHPPSSRRFARDWHCEAEGMRAVGE